MAVYGPVLAVGDVLQCVFRMRLDDQLGLNVRHWRVAAISTTGTNQMNQFSDAIAAGGFAAAYKALMPSQAIYEGFNVRRIQPVLSLDYSFDDGTGPGTAGDKPIPRQCAGFIRLRSDIPGHGKSGRMYVPFPDEDDCQPNGLPEDNYMNGLATLVTKFTNSMVWGTGGTFIPIIYSRPDLTADPPRGYSFADVRSFVPIRKFATQRRRGSFGRTNPV